MHTSLLVQESHRSDTCSLARSLVPWLSRSVAYSRATICSFARERVCSVACSLVVPLVRSLDRSLVRYFVRSLAQSFVLSFAGLWRSWGGSCVPQRTDGWHDQYEDKWVSDCLGKVAGGRWGRAGWTNGWKDGWFLR